MKTYLKNLITEKGIELEADINLDGHFGLTWAMLVDFVSAPELKEHHNTIRTTLVKIDFLNGDVFHYLRHLAEGMVKSLGY
tara:strand:+ start:2743 stop:2985 length:243 start_codon:yes stop_codon:yes gene_type:complete